MVIVRTRLELVRWLAIIILTGLLWLYLGRSREDLFVAFIAATIVVRVPLQLVPWALVKLGRRPKWLVRLQSMDREEQ